jgi:gamma-glutamyl-gamma-aminobutyrate hydrolase PuuD
MTSKKVYFVGKTNGYLRMFETYGWLITEDIKESDLVQFTGGADVTPILYNQHQHSKTHCDSVRDKREVFFFLLALKYKKPMAGICRGGQFLNVMCGGAMWQHVLNHTFDHEVTDYLTGKTFKASSTHHQMMIPSKDKKDYTILMTAENITISKEKCAQIEQENKPIIAYGHKQDLEALYYSENKCLCFQPHPEFEKVDYAELTKTYFQYLDTVY